MDNNTTLGEIKKKIYSELKNLGKAALVGTMIGCTFGKGCDQINHPIKYIPRYIETMPNNMLREIATNDFSKNDTIYFVGIGDGKYSMKKKYDYSVKDSLDNVYKQKTDSINIVMANQKQHTIDSLMNYRK